MVQDPGDDERRQLTEERIKELDGRGIPSPSARAQLIWEVIQGGAPGVTNWDVLCFCAEFVGLSSQEYHWLDQPAKQLARMVYAAHYLFPEQINAASAINGRVDPRSAESRAADTWADNRRKPEEWSARSNGPRSLFERRDPNASTQVHVSDSEGNTGARVESSPARHDGRGTDSDPST